MIKMIRLTCVLLALAFWMTACGGGAANNKTNANANAKPANAAANTASNSNAAAKKVDKPTTALKNEEKPKKEGKTASKKVPVPASWIYVYDEKKGYGFAVPEGTTGGSETVEGIDVFVGTTPAPAEVGIYVLSYKDSKLTKEDLLNDAVKFLEGMGETVKKGELTNESSEYAVAEATSTSKEGAKSKVKILVGTDVTDNYVMILATDEAKFDAHKDIIDAIWGSFEIWSGGASSD